MAKQEMVIVLIPLEMTVPNTCFTELLSAGLEESEDG